MPTMDGGQRPNSGSPKPTARQTVHSDAVVSPSGRTSPSQGSRTSVLSPTLSPTADRRKVAALPVAARPSVLDALDDFKEERLGRFTMIGEWPSSPSASPGPAGRRVSVTFSSLFIEDSNNDPHKGKPDIVVGPLDTTNFTSRITPEWGMKLTKMTIRWHNFTPSYDGVIYKMMMAFSAWSFKILLHEHPSKRKPADIAKLVLFHAANMQTLKDASGFVTFSSVSKRGLQAFYRHAVMKTLAPNTPIFVQGQLGAHQDRYFILLHGSVQTFAAVKEERIKDISRSVTHVLSTPFSEPLLAGYLGKPVSTLRANVGFGGVQFADSLHGTWTSSAVTATECELIIVSEQLYDALLREDHTKKFVLAKRARDLATIPAFSSLPPAHVLALSPFFSNVTYVAQQRLVSLGSELRRLVVVLSGTVNIVAYVVDPLDATGLAPAVPVDVAECGPGAIIGDIELAGGGLGKPGKGAMPLQTFVFGCVALSERVETLEIKIEDFKRLIWEHFLCTSARKDILDGALKKAEFHRLRIGEIMLNRAIEGRKAAAEKALLDERRGGVIDMLRRKRKDDENKRKKWEEDNPPKIVVPAYPNVIEDLLHPVADPTSERGFRVVSRYGDRTVFVPENKSARIPSVVVSKAQPPPYEDPSMRGSSRGGSRNALSTTVAGER